MIADLPCEPPSVPVIARLDEPIDAAAAACCVHEGRPYLLFEDWGYAEDWSGEFVHPIPPVDLANARRVSTGEFWALVRELHPAPE